MVRVAPVIALGASSFGFPSSFVIRISSLSWLAFAQQDHADSRDENEYTDDLERQVVILEQQRTNAVDIVDGRSFNSAQDMPGQRRERVVWGVLNFVNI